MVKSLKCQWRKSAPIPLSKSAHGERIPVDGEVIEGHSYIDGVNDYELGLFL